MKSPNHPWTTTQIKLLRLIFPVATWKKLTRELAPHTRAAILKKAARLGISKRHARWNSVVEFHAPTFKFPVKNRVPEAKKKAA